MAAVPVQSTSIKSVDYHPGDRTLTVEFHSGATHRYHDVPADDHAALMGDGVPGHSIGKHFHAHIKNRFASSKVEA